MDTVPRLDAKRLRERRDRVARSWQLDRGGVLVPAGAPIPIAGTDQVHEYHAHPEHRYLVGETDPSSVLAFDPDEGWVLFAPQMSREELVWTNAPAGPGELGERSAIDAVEPLDRLRPWLERRRGEPLAVIGNDDLLHHPERYGLEGLPSLELAVDGEQTEQLRELVAEQRRAKDVDELALMRAAAAASVQGHLRGLRWAQAGTSERELQIEIEAEFFRNGGDRTAYGSIVGSGPNGAVLHFAPGGRVLGPGELVLVDAGAEVGAYASDVTRTFPVSGRFQGIQRDLYDLVYATQQEAIAGAVPGNEYKELHLAAAERIAAGLADLGILRGRPSDLVEADAHALFFPHGLGHMIGLSTHDAGGCLAGREPSDRFGLKYLRADLPLAPGYVVTIEPGIYFIRALLTDPQRRARYREMVDWERVDAMLDFGGIRIEDDVLITDDGNDVLSAALPSARAEIEAIREQAGGA